MFSLICGSKRGLKHCCLGLIDQLDISSSVKHQAINVIHYRSNNDVLWFNIVWTYNKCLYLNDQVLSGTIVPEAVLTIV